MQKIQFLYFISFFLLKFNNLKNLIVFDADEDVDDIDDDDDDEPKSMTFFAYLLTEYSN